MTSATNAPGQTQQPQRPGQFVSQAYVRTLFDKIKKGSVADIVNTIRDNCIDVSLLRDEQNF